MNTNNNILMKFISTQSAKQMREGGENDREMVEGIADILTQVQDPANRKRIAQNMIGDFERENVNYSLDDFLSMSKVEMASGGQHGGLDRWFAEKWVDIKTGKECGRQEGEKRKGYPACRPSKRVSEDTPKTASELSSSEKDKFKRSKTSSKRISYQHNRKAEGGEQYDMNMMNMKDGGNVPTNPELWSRAKAAAKAKYDVYPSAYANGFAAKWYKERGGGWKKAEMGGCMECGGQMEEGGSLEMYAPNPMEMLYADGGMSPEMQVAPQQQQQTPDISSAVSEVSRLIMNGEDPQELYAMMIENGVDDDYAKDILEEAMESLEETDLEEEEIPMDNDEMNEYEQRVQQEEEDYAALMLAEDDPEIDPADEMKRGGTIKINPAKKGTFKAQATKMGMSVAEAADYIMRHKEEFSPAMVKKANFAKNFARELGGEIFDLEQYKDGGGIPQRYRNMGFTKVGAKKKSTRPGKKWMVLAKKGDQYKVVHGGWKGMQDFKQHRNSKRKERFWDRMGGKDSAKAKDPFSPLYWHKRFGTWAEGGEPNVTTITTKNTLANLENNKFNRGLAMANTLGDPRNMVWALPNKGLLGKIKAIAGAAAGLSGAALGYEKLFAKDKTETYIDGKLQSPAATTTPTPAAPVTPAAPAAPTAPMTKTGGSGMGSMYMQDMENEAMMNGLFPESSNSATPAAQTPAPVAAPNRVISTGSGMGNMYMQDIENEYAYAGVVHNPFNHYLPKADVGGTPPTFKEWFIKNAQRPDVMQNSANQALLMEMWKRETSAPSATGSGPIPAAPANNAGRMTRTGGSGMGAMEYLDAQQEEMNNALGLNPDSTATGNPSVVTDPARQKFTWSSTTRGDSAGQIAANNALAGLGMVNSVLSDRNYEKEYEEMLRRTGNTDQRYNAYNPTNPFGNYTLNAGPASNFALVTNTPIQDFGTKMAGARYGGTTQYAEGGEYYVSDKELKMILAMGGEIEFLD